MTTRLLLLCATLLSLTNTNAYELLIDTDPSNGFGTIDPANTVIEGQTFQVDVYLKREAGDPPIDAYGITLEFNSGSNILSHITTDPVNAHANPAGGKSTLDGTTIIDPSDLDPANNILTFTPLTTGSTSLTPLLNTANNSPSANSVNGFNFNANTSGQGIYSDTTTAFNFAAGEMILLEAIFLTADIPGFSELGLAGIFNQTAANAAFSTAPGSAFANLNQQANAFPLYDSTGTSGSKAVTGTTFTNGQITVNAIPEASSLALLGLGLLGIAMRRKFTFPKA